MTNSLTSQCPPPPALNSPACTTVVRQVIGSSRPATGRTVSLAERVHAALVRKAGQGRRFHAPELTGQNAAGQPLTGRHQHLHVLPVDLDGDGLIDHLVLHAPMGLGPLTLAAIDQLTLLYGDTGKPWLRLLPSRNQRLVDALQIPTMSLAPRLTNGPADTWQTLTPFVPPRYLKKTGKNSLIQQVLAELQSRGTPPAIVHATTYQQPLSPAERFLLQRTPSHQQPPQRIGFSLQIQFASPPAGPLSIGYGSHFGLGLLHCISFPA